MSVEEDRPGPDRTGPEQTGPEQTGQGRTRPYRPRSPKGRARLAFERLSEAYPDARCELDFRDPFELLTATILSAQTTDVRVNMVTPELFAAYPDAESLASADPEDVERIIHSTGFYRAKTRSIMSMAQSLVDRFGGTVPSSMKDLTSLAGVGRKTANVVRAEALDLPGLPVDTHVLRLSRLLDLTDETDPVKVEMALNPMVRATDRGRFSLVLILHGRRVCIARRPRCEDCVLNDFCPSSKV